MLKKTILSTTLATIAVFAVVTLNSCKKTNCYDAGMAKAHSGICTMDCPGVTACNGKFYCNTCEANKAGYRVDE
jgi:hypothetical protein